MTNVKKLNNHDDSLYRELVLDHWENPLNYGKIKSPDIKSVGHNPVCGDQIEITAVVKKGVLTDVAFESTGCAISKASASLFLEKIKGEKIKKIRSLKPKDALEELGITLTPARTKCALLVFTTFQKHLK